MNKHKVVQEARHKRKIHQKLRRRIGELNAALIEAESIGIDVDMVVDEKRIGADEVRMNRISHNIKN